MEKNISIILYSNHKHIIEKQIQHLITNQQSINTVFTFYAICNDHIKSHVKTFNPNIFNSLSKCYHSIYKHIEEINCSSEIKTDYVIEIDCDCFIDIQYIRECLEYKMDIIGTQSVITIIDNTLQFNRSKTNIPMCRCFSRKFLNQVMYNLYNFENDDYQNLSHSFCILSGATIFTILCQTVFCFKEILTDMYKSTIHNKEKLKWINSVLSDTTNILFNNYGIYTVRISDNIKFFKDKIIKKYNLSSATNDDCNEKMLFFGMYDENDVLALQKHTGQKYILWGGSDIDNRIEKVKNIIEIIQNDLSIVHFASSKSIQSRLTNLSIECTMINFSLVDNELYSKAYVNNDQKSKCIYIYDGNLNDIIYNVSLCNEIKSRLCHKYDFVFRSEINLTDRQVLCFYQTCFMGIRLCENDGNANTVQEMGLLGLPVLHNGELPNSVPWINDIDYICDKIDYIYENFQDKKTIIKDSVIKYLNESKRSNMCIFVPMWQRHDVVRKNITLLLNQEYDKRDITHVNVIVMYSNDKDKEFCKSITHPNYYPIQTINRPLSKKFQMGAEFCKIFYPYGTIINGSDDFLSLNFAQSVYNIFNTTDSTYFGSNYWYVGDTLAMILYKFTYNDPMRVVGCGRSFKYTLLNDLNWQVFPLNKNSGIDGASKDMIHSKAIPHSSNLETCFTFSFKEKTDMITPMSNLLKSDHSTWSIISKDGTNTTNDNLCQILYANTIDELVSSFRLKPIISSLNPYMFVTILDDTLKQSNPVMLNSFYMTSVLSTHCDIVDLRSFENKKDFNYSLIFIDGIALNTRTTKLDKTVMFSLLQKIKHIPKVLLAHDIHDYSFDFDNNCQPKYVGKPLKPIYSLTSEKMQFLSFLQLYNFEYIIGICDCPEFDLMVKYYSGQIKRFYLMTHHIPESIFKYTKCDRKYDILIYGWANEIVYPFRSRLRKLLEQSEFNVKMIERTTDITKMPVEHELASLINQSWLVVTCVSNFSYLVRKYFEIASCGAIPCGTINNQGRTIFGNNVIEITEQMSDYEIIRIITYYLNNKCLLMKMSDEIKTLSVQYNYNSFMRNLLEIKDNILFDTSTDLLYHNQKNIYSHNTKNKMNILSNSCQINTWVSNQQVNIEFTDSKITVNLLQDKSTPGIKTSYLLKEGMYILTFNLFSEQIKIKVFIFNEKNVQIPINEQICNNVVTAYLQISEKSKYTIMILASNPCINGIFKISYPSIVQLYSHNLDYSLLPHFQTNNTYFCSMSCNTEIEKLCNTFGGYKLDKNFIMNKGKINKEYNTLVLLGLYSPHHWQKYIHLFNQFNKIIIIFTGTDILQLNDEKVKNKSEIVEWLRNNSNCCSLNLRNKNEIKQLHNLDTNIMSLPISSSFHIEDIACPMSNKIACYVGSNLKWYNFDLLISIANELPEYEFYIYKFNGFSNDIIDKYLDTNIILNTETIVNVYEFLRDKLCSLRLTIHDGEPMSGIETMLLNKPFIFNHEMKYSINVSIDIETIVNTIRNIKPYDEQEYRNICEYYSNRNSTRIFEQNLHFYSKLNNIYMELQPIQTQYYQDTEVLLPFTLNFIKNKKYRVYISGLTDDNAYGKLIVKGSKVLNNTYNTMNIFNSITFVDFISISNIKIYLSIKTCEMTELDIEYIRICSIN